MSEHYLDVTGLKCPLPILRAKKALAALACGDVLTVDATDAARRTILPLSAAKPAMCCWLRRSGKVCSGWLSGINRLWRIKVQAV